MTNDNFSRKGMREEKARGDLNIETKEKGKLDKGALKQLIDYQYKMNRLQYIAVAVMMLAGLVINFIKKDGIGITVGSLVQGDITVSNVTVNLGALLIIGSLLAFINIIKNSNVNFKG